MQFLRSILPDSLECLKRSLDTRYSARYVQRAMSQLCVLTPHWVHRITFYDRKHLRTEHGYSNAVLPSTYCQTEETWLVHIETRLTNQRFCKLYFPHFPHSIAGLCAFLSCFYKLLVPLSRCIRSKLNTLPNNIYVFFYQDNVCFTQTCSYLMPKITVISIVYTDYSDLQ